jgi:pyruvate dehydrogenase E1 component alpha subunit
VKVEQHEDFKLLHNMMRVRRMEELCAELYTQEKIRGFLHLYIGEEAVVTGVMSLLRPQDNVMGTYREHAHALLKGVSAKSIMAEMFGKIGGCSRGRGGSMHLICTGDRFFGGNAIVAAGIPQAVGLALASKKLNEDRQTVCFFGEGAVAEGVFHESLNMAELWKIPVLFCCENNYYAMGTAIGRSQAQLNLPRKAEAHNVTAQSVDGMNIYEVIEKTREALDFIKREGRPYFLEFRTYRFRPHSMFDPELYRSKEEVTKWKDKDPINLLIETMKKNNVFSQEIMQKLEREVDKEMQEAVSFAENSEDEPLEDLEKHLYENDL